MDYKELHLSIIPCPEAIVYLETQPDKQSAWDNCGQGHWLLWWATHLDSLTPGSAQHRKIVLASCGCGQLSLPYAGKRRSKLETMYSMLGSWCNGDDGQDLKAIATAAYAADYAAAAAYATAAYAAAADYAAAAAYATAAYAAAADYAASAASAAAAYAASAAAAYAACAEAAYAEAAYAACASAAASADARAAVSKQCADLVRSILDCPA